MKLALLALLTAAIVAGCASPGAGQDSSTFKSANPPKAAGDCMSRNQLQAGGLTPKTAEKPDGSVEFFAPINAANQFYAVITPTPNGSQITVYTAKVWRDGAAAILLKGC